MQLILTGMVAIGQVFQQDKEFLLKLILQQIY